MRMNDGAVRPAFCRSMLPQAHAMNVRSSRRGMTFVSMKWCALFHMSDPKNALGKVETPNEASQRDARVFASSTVISRVSRLIYPYANLQWSLSRYDAGTYLYCEHNWRDLSTPACKG